MNIKKIIGLWVLRKALRGGELVLDNYGKVSIIMPAYNCEQFIMRAIKTVEKQTYIDWELIIVNDCSSDNTLSIIQNKSCEKIIVLSNEKNSGAAFSRNRAIEIATGKYIAFLDSDDLWVENKLEKQLKFMEEHQLCFSCTSYNKIDVNDNDLNRVIKAFDLDYDGLLKYSPGNSTVIYNSEKLGKFYTPLIKKRNDYIMWLQVIKKAEKLSGLNEVLGSHRIGMQSISSNKFSLIKYHWYIYREVEKLSFIKSAYLVVFWIGKKIFRFN